ncbi:hypothetical protein PK35_16570 [Tamlana nanhaiensis]|uniref:Fibronectin type-III domain-containing protein n=1 Tax=Neotamlana nanhaiensis TaxID=1382798 RepID=A0A0D7VW64_9FLAO|nr:DUF5123 domain-containing protein [Tamlana nanhaiensis]KJD31091.1 hypothetical protein PK35_16570 [Tamlana nanhaiensis]
MKTIYIFKIIPVLLLAILVTGCGYNEDVIEELSISREFAPTDLSVFIRNQTNVELNWVTDDNIDYYVAEFSADDPTFSTIYLSQQIDASELPIQIRLEGETLYAIRIKAVSNRGLNDSSWVIAEAETLTEQIMLPSQPGDIQALQATLRWEAGLNVTHFILQPGDVRYDLSAQEIAAGVATIPDLMADTDYQGTLYNNAKIRGTSTFKTGIDIGDNTLVLPSDDLFQMIADAESGDILLLEQGDYTSQVGSVTLDKSITIQGLRTDFKPLLKIGFSIAAGAEDVSLIDLDIAGDSASELIDMVSYSDVGNFNSMLISGCNIHDFDRSFVRGSTSGSVLQTLTIENSIVSNVLTAAGDFIDFRSSDVLNVNITTSTFNNCAPGRDFLRLDASGVSNGNSNCNILIDSCTLYGCSNSDSRRILYVRFVTNDVTVRNTLIAETDSEGYADRSGIDETPTFSNNNYFNAPGFSDSNQYIFDGSGSDLDPGFANAANGDFTITNQTIIDNQIGDPRWRQ